MVDQSILPHDEAIQNLDNFSNNLNASNVGFKDFLNQLTNLSGTFTRLDKSILQNNAALNNGLGNLVHSNRMLGAGLGGNARQQRPNASYNPMQPFMPDLGDMFATQFQHPSVSRLMDKTFRSAV